MPTCGACGETIDGVTVLDVDQNESDIFDCADCGATVWPYHIGCPACGSLTPLYGTPKVEYWTCNTCGTSDHESESDAESCCTPCCEQYCDHCGECDCGIDHTANPIDTGILDSQPGYDVYGFATGAESIPERHHVDAPDGDGFPCLCEATDCPNYGTLRNPYL